MTHMSNRISELKRAQVKLGDEVYPALVQNGPGFGDDRNYVTLFGQYMSQAAREQVHMSSDNILVVFGVEKEDDIRIMRPEPLDDRYVRAVAEMDGRCPVLNGERWIFTRDFFRGLVANYDYPIMFRYEAGGQVAIRSFDEPKPPRLLINKIPVTFEDRGYPALLEYQGLKKLEYMTLTPEFEVNIGGI